MDWPYHFPHPADVIADDAERFRSAPPAERVRRLGELADLAAKFAAISPNRAGIEFVHRTAEEQWQAAHRRVFELYGSR